MKGNEISANRLTTNGGEWIKKLIQVLTIKEYGPGTIESYGYEMTLLFKYFHYKKVENITQEDIEQYIMYINTAHNHSTPCTTKNRC